MTDDDEPFNNPFAAVFKGQASSPKEPKAPARAVVRMERKGRGGKEVTVVEQLGLKPKELDEWLKALKTALGCGGVIEGDSLVLQGDQRKRLPAILEARGVRRVISG
jgi:translation initiation factor 1